MAFLYEYMTPDELEVAKEQAEFENASMKLDHSLECLRMEHAIRINNIDTECMINEYTQDDLENMYTQEMAMYMEGVKEWWAKFKAWVASIINKITGKKNPEADATAKKSNEEVEMDYDPKEAKTILAKVNGILHKVTDVKKDDGSGVDPKKLAARLGIGAAAAAATAGAVFLATKKKTKVKKSELPTIRDELQGELNGLNQTIQGLPEPSGSDAAADAQAQAIKDIGTGAVKWGQDIINQAIRFIMGGGNASASGDTKALPPSSEGGDSGSNSNSGTGIKISDLKAKFTPEIEEGWKILMGARGKKPKGGYPKIDKLSMIESYLNNLSGERKEKAKKVIDFLKSQGVGANTTLEFVEDDIDETEVPTMESTEYDFITEGTEFTGNLKELLDLANML